MPATQTPSGTIPVTLLTGFLGSGKTTVLNHLVCQPELADALVIINEFGEVALDHLLVAHSTENLAMEMSSGCLCCTIRGDLVKTLRDITWRFSRNGRRQFQRVLIETTGLADPAPIIHTLMNHPQIASKYRLDGIVATMDVATGMHVLDQHQEALKQAAVADVLLLTKADLAGEEQRVALLRRLEGINPAAPRWDVENGVIDREDNPLKHAPHPAHVLLAAEWPHAYSREQAAYPLASLRDGKYWPPVSRVDTAHGDRNLVCACLPIEAYM